MGWMYAFIQRILTKHHTGTALSPGDRAGNRADRKPCLHGTGVLTGKTDKKQDGKGNTQEVSCDKSDGK